MHIRLVRLCTFQHVLSEKSFATSREQRQEWGTASYPP